MRPAAQGLTEVVADKGYHSNQSLVDLEAVGVRSYISEPDRGRRNWKNHADVRMPCTAVSRATSWKTCRRLRATCRGADRRRLD